MEERNGKEELQSFLWRTRGAAVQIGEEGVRVERGKGQRKRKEVGDKERKKSGRGRGRGWKDGGKGADAGEKVTTESEQGELTSTHRRVLTHSKNSLGSSTGFSPSTAFVLPLAQPSRTYAPSSASC